MKCPDKDFVIEFRSMQGKDPERRWIVRLVFPAGMATGGSGDVLSGIIASLTAQGMEPYNAACLGVYLHGLAGDEAAARLGEHAMIASDIIDALPSVLKTAEGI